VEKAKFEEIRRLMVHRHITLDEGGEKREVIRVLEMKSLVEVGRRRPRMRGWDQLRGQYRPDWDLDTLVDHDLAGLSCLAGERTWTAEVDLVEEVEIVLVIVAVAATV